MLSSREGRLYRLRFEACDLALKVHDDEQRLEHELFFFGSLRGSRVPVPRVWASRLAGDPAHSPWLLRDWVAGDQAARDDAALGRQLGALVRALHAVPVEGAGGRAGAAWLHLDWAAFVRAEMEAVPAQVDALPEPAPVRARYREVIQRAFAAARALGGPCALLHGDLGIDNVVIHDGDVRGLIDPGWCLGGHPLMDVSYFLIATPSRELLREGFLTGYGEIPGGAALDLFCAYQLLGKLIHFAATGSVEKYATRRAQLEELLGA